MIPFEEWRLCFTVNLVQPVESTFWDDMNISILFDKITLNFSLKDMNCSFKFVQFLFT